MNKSLLAIICFQFFLLISFYANGGGEMIDMSELPDDFTPIDESDRTDRMQNECMVYKLISFLQEVYKSDSAYPGEAVWAKVIGDKFLTKGYSDCARRLSFSNGHINDYFGDYIQYKFFSSKKIIIYSKNSKFFSKENKNGEIPIMAFMLTKEKVKAFPIW